jgi:hypothetical protein
MGQVRVGNAILQLLMHRDGYLESLHSWDSIPGNVCNGFGTSQCAELNVRSDQHTAVKSARPDSGLT